MDEDEDNDYHTHNQKNTRLTLPVYSSFHLIPLLGFSILLIYSEISVSSVAFGKRGFVRAYCAFLGARTNGSDQTGADQI